MKKANKKVKQPFERKRDINENCVSPSETGAGEVNVREGQPPPYISTMVKREKEKKVMSKKFSIS